MTDERAYNLAKAMAAFNRAMDIHQAHTVSQGTKLTDEEHDELRALGNIIERAAARRQQDKAD